MREKERGGESDSVCGDKSKVHYDNGALSLAHEANVTKTYLDSYQKTPLCVCMCTCFCHLHVLCVYPVVSIH